jgi:hypothetical protein
MKTVNHVIEKSQSSVFYGKFVEVLKVNGLEFGYYVRMDEVYGLDEYKVKVFSERNQRTLSYECNAEGVERSLNNFLSRGFNFSGWEFEGSDVRVKIQEPERKIF